MLNWADRFNIFCFLDNQGYSLLPHHYDCLLAAGSVATAENDLAAVDRMAAEKKHWLFGHISYDYKNQLYPLPPARQDRIGFPLSFFFIPRILVQMRGQELTIEAENPEEVFQSISGTQIRTAALETVRLEAEFSREDYIETLRKLKGHILRGDCYEINFCQEFFAEGAQPDPVSLYRRLTQLSPNPFSALYRKGESYLICASPERFLARTGPRVFSQPMKGTSRRDPQDPEKDLRLKQALAASAKDRSENVMVVDLVRNDLSRVCEDGSVQVDELFGVYSFPRVHQMVSTVSGICRDVSFSELMAAVFPMGSMTGAPKLRVMELIDRYERSARGLFSGTMGYIRPDGDFDLNVVIRSVLYNRETGRISAKAGSGITFYSDPEAEWEECLLKAAAIREALGGS